MEFLTGFAIVLAILVILFAAYVFIFTRPRKSKKIDEALITDYAHRGLHGNGIPENSLLAFEKAVENGYGIELDIQLSKDGEVMVFHDYTLLRMTGVDKKLCELTATELGQIKLADSDQYIPTFKQVLELVNGRVPLLVELKGEDLNSSLCQKAGDLLKDYKGKYCVESFNPLLIKNIKKFLPDTVCGQLYINLCRDKKKYTILNILLTLMMFNFLAKPDFIAYCKEDRKFFPVLLAVKLHKAPNFVWTIRGKEEFDEAHSLGEHPIFEKIN